MSTTSTATRDRAEPHPGWRRNVVQRIVPAVAGLGFAAVLTIHGTQGLAQPPPTAPSRISVTEARLTEDGQSALVPRGPVNLVFTVRNSYAFPVRITAVGLAPTLSRSCQTRLALDPSASSGHRVIPAGQSLVIELRGAVHVTGPACTTSPDALRVTVTVDQAD